MKDKFFNEFSIISMKRNSILCMELATNKQVYIHRESFNALVSNQIVDYRVTEVTHMGLTSNWIEVLVWKRL